ncbi:hypothetical protein GQ457_08G030610 [Hibiscus cannabinus]
MGLALPVAILGYYWRCELSNRSQSPRGSRTSFLSDNSLSVTAHAHDGFALTWSRILSQAWTVVIVCTVFYGLCCCKDR